MHCKSTCGCEQQTLPTQPMCPLGHSIQGRSPDNRVSALMRRPRGRLTAQSRRPPESCGCLARHLSDGMGVTNSIVRRRPRGLRVSASVGSCHAHAQTTRCMAEQCRGLAYGDQYALQPLLCVQPDLDDCAWNRAVLQPCLLGTVGNSLRHGLSDQASALTIRRGVCYQCCMLG